MVCSVLWWGISMNNYLLWWPIAGLIVFVLFIAFILIVKP
jgi:hypothetical protein